MATAEMIQELIRAHVSGDADRFRQVALQVAAREARSGHRLSAGKIRDLLETAPAEAPAPTPIARPSRDLQGILDVQFPNERLDSIVLEKDAKDSIDRLLAEHLAEGQLREWGLSPRQRLLFHGPPGCGKTLCATVIAGELSLPLFRVKVETLFSRYMGETAVLLSEVFAHAQSKRGVYLFDEFDAIGKHRGDENDVGEAKRIVSTFLQLIDGGINDSIVIAATNERGSLDRALFRRFDDVVEFELPSEAAILRLLQIRTARYSMPRSTLKAIAKRAQGLSFADIANSVTEAVKTMVLDGRSELEREDLASALQDAHERLISA
jgi:SpoVK/Ycf46/Vps4 family AAA+-type ATPase